MKILTVLAMLLLAGCAAPKATLPNIENDNTIYSVDFSTIKVQYQPAWLSYPKQAKEEKVQGTVIVDITMDRTGKPISAKAIDGPLLLRSAAEEYSML